MTKSKELKIKRIKTIHVWPALTGFVISVILLFGLLMAIISIDLLYVVESDYSGKYEASEYISQSVQRDYERGITFDNALARFAGKKLCIIDSSNNVVAPQADLDIDFGSEFEVGITQARTFFTERGNHEGWVSEDGDLTPDAKLLISKAFKKAYYGENWFEDELYSIGCWMVMPASLDGYRLLIREEVQIVRKDVLFIVIVAAAMIVLLLIPLCIMLINVFSSVRAHRQMKAFIYLDEVTGGNNWNYYKDAARRELTKRGNRNKAYAVVDLQLMKYGSLCACYGVEEGERVLEQINDIICANIDKRGICTRYSRSTFALLLECKDAEDAKNRIEFLIDALTRASGRYRLIFHAGYYMINPLGPADDKKVREDIDIPAVYNSAGAARASIANLEQSSVAIFSDKLLEDQLWENKVEEEMYAALKNREFVVYYQPKYDPVTQKLAGAEALIRWVKEDGLVPPGKFIPIFEKNGFITKIDDYMIDNVARQQAQWLKDGENIVPVSVNVSRAHFTQEDLAEHILEIVDRYDIPHEYIEIELTESAFFDDKKALLNTVKRLKEYGFEISMDDFGAGYSSLNSLKDLPLDVLKLDAEFFRGEDNGNRANIVVTEAISLGKQLEMRIVAEGIEKKEQVDFLADAGCDMIQGYYFAKPMPANEYEERMRGNIHIS